MIMSTLEDQSQWRVHDFPLGGEGRRPAPAPSPDPPMRRYQNVTLKVNTDIFEDYLDLHFTEIYRVTFWTICYKKRILSKENTGETFLIDEGMLLFHAAVISFVINK